MEKGLVSICIPNYNNEKFIGFAIESALRQTYNNIEIIIVDNNSTDKSWEIIQSFNDPKIIAKKNTENIGMYPNFLETVKLSSGEFIKFICADDTIEIDFLEKTIAYFTDLSIGIVTTGQKKIDQTNNIVGFRRVPNNNTHKVLSANSLGYFINSTNPIGNPTRTIIRKSYFDEMGGFRLDVKYCNDLDLWMRISKKYDLFFVKDYLSNERKHENQSTIFYNKTGEDFKNVILCWMFNYPGLSDKMRTRLLKRSLFTFYYTAFTRKKREGVGNSLDNCCRIIDGFIINKRVFIILKYKAILRYNINELKSLVLRFYKRLF